MNKESCCSTCGSVISTVVKISTPKISSRSTASDVFPLEKVKDEKLWIDFEKELLILPEETLRRYVKILPNRQSLMTAVLNNNYSACLFFCKHGANVNQLTTASMWSPLHTAAMLNNMLIVKLLIEYGANPTKRVRVINNDNGNGNGKTKLAEEITTNEEIRKFLERKRRLWPYLYDAMRTIEGQQAKYSRSRLKK